MKNNLLTISIPTYNRATILDEALEDLIPKISKYNFEIIVCDNCSTDNTSDIVHKHKKVYEHIRYFKQEKNIKDKNFVTCHQLALTKYNWILGDSTRVYEEYFTTIIDLLTCNEYDAIIVNSHNRIKGVPSKVYYDPGILMSEIGWHLGLISSTIVSKKMTSDDTVWRYLETNFIHMGLFFEFFAKSDNSKMYWLGDNVATHTKINKSSTSWLSRSLEIYGKGYMAFVLSLPSQIPVDIKLKCIKDHSLNQGLFEIKNLAFLRSQGWLSYKQVTIYKNYIPFLTDTKWYQLVIISLIPSLIFKMMRNIYLAFK